jgi:hypothetical protein
MKSRSKTTFMFLGILVCAIIILTAAQSRQRDRYQLLEYPLMVVRMDTETGVIDLINLQKDVVDGSRVPYSIIKVDCQKATYNKEFFSER